MICLADMLVDSLTACQIPNSGDGEILIESLDLTRKTIFGHSRKMIRYILRRWFLGDGGGHDEVEDNVVMDVVEMQHTK